MDDRITDVSGDERDQALIGRIRQAGSGTYGRRSGSWSCADVWEPDAKIYVASAGSATYAIHSSGAWRSLRIRPGSVVMIPGGCRHRYHTTHGITLRWMHVPIISDDLQRRLLAAGRILTVPAIASLNNLTLLDNQPDLQDLAVQAQLQVVALAALASALVDLPAAPMVTDQAMLAVREWCARQCRQHPSREAVAHRAGLSVPHLHRRFTAAFGETPTAWMERCRLAIAQRLLRTTDMSVHEVAAAAGYDDPYYFSRVFTRRVGVPPSRFAGGTP